MARKAAFLLFKIASGPRFHEGNKRTALVACASFLERNGYAMDIRADRLLRVLDNASILASTLKETYVDVRRLIRNVQNE